MRIRFLLTLIFLSLFSFIVPVQAAETSCDCYCRSSEGSVQLDSPEINGDACRDACKDADSSYSFLGCYPTTEVDARPENNRLCWNETACLNSTLETDAGPTPSVWGGQEAFCPYGQGYCYNPPGAVAADGSTTRVVLNVPIGSLKSATTIRDYIIAVYSFMLIAGSLLAVVMLMIAGVLWVTAAGGSGQIQKAKDMMAQSVLGLVLLFSAYTIANLIDPALVALKFGAAPRIRPIEFIDQSSSCERLQQSGLYTFEIVPNVGDELCGNTGTIKSIKDKKTGEVLDRTEGFKVDDPCNYLTCSGGRAERCLRDKNQKFTCLRCDGIFPGNDAGIMPSPSVCSNFTVGKVTKDNKTVYHECLYSEDASVVVGKVTNLEQSAGGLLGTTGTCAVLFSQCATVTSCADYDKTFLAGGGSGSIVPSGIFPYNVMGWVSSALSNGDEGDITTTDGGEHLRDVCTATDDPCGVGPCAISVTNGKAHCSKK